MSLFLYINFAQRPESPFDPAVGGSFQDVNNSKQKVITHLAYSGSKQVRVALDFMKRKKITWIDCEWKKRLANGN